MVLKSKFLSIFLTRVMLSGRVYLTFLETSGTFRLQVLEKGEKIAKKVLKTELVLPQKKSTVFGFEDSKGKPFFLAFERAQDSRIKIILLPSSFQV